MQHAYGAFTHLANEVNLVRFDVRHRYSPRGKKLTRLITANLLGELQYDTQAALTARIQEIIDVYSQDLLDWRFRQDDGADTPHGLTNSGDCVSGVRVRQRSWPVGDAAEYATKRTFSVTLQAEYADVETTLVYWKEEIRYRGNCGPRFEVVDTFLGPFFYQTAVATAQHIVQRGEAVGYLAYVEPPGPAFPASEHFDRREIDLGSGTNQGVEVAFFPTRWAYHFTSAVNLAGVPPISR